MKRIRYQWISTGVQLLICILFVNIFFQFARSKLDHPTMILNRAEEIVVQRKLQISNTGEDNNSAVALAQVPDEHFAPFRPTEKRRVLLVAQQRSGSTFLGEMFNQNPDAFYWFEPLDGVFNAIYGSVPGWNVPSDLNSLPDGSPRIIPPYEHDIAAETVANILNCEFEKVPTAVILHNLVMIFRKYQKKMEPFIRCVKTSAFKKTMDCRDFIKSTCPHRFGSNWERMKLCYENLYGNKEEVFDIDGYYRESLSDPTDPLQKNLNKYKMCMNQRRKEMLPCLSVLKKSCQKSQIRVVKTVRMTMENAMKVYKHIPNLRLILNIRNPVGIAISRQRTFKGNSYMSIYAGKNATKEAELLCRVMKKDLEMFDLERGNNKMLLLVHEQTSSDPTKIINKIYRFIDQPVPWEVSYWKHEATKNSSTLSTAWTYKVSLGDYLSIRTICNVIYEKHGTRFGWELKEIV